MVAALVAELEGHVVDVAAHTNGSWSVCAAHRATHAAFIPAELAAAVSRLAREQDGSRAVQRVLAEGSSRGADVSALLDGLITLGGPQLGALADDQFGNYAVQNALRAAPPSCLAALLGLLLPRLPQLASSKSGSNAAEAVVGLLPAEKLQEARRLLLGDGLGATPLATHRFGRHVVAALQRREKALSAQ